MKNMISPIKNQQGSVMALALMVMVTLTIAGLTAINDTVVESSIARNHAIYRQSLYLAEAAVRQAVQIMDDYTADFNVTNDLLIDDSDDTWVRHYINYDFHDVDVGDFRGDHGAPDYGDFHTCGVNNAGFLVRYEGIAAGSSLDMTDPTSLYQFSLYGRGVGAMRNDNTESIVKCGYRMRF